MRKKELSAKGDTLERLNGLVDFELFRPDLERAVPRADRSRGGRPPFDHVLMFKVLILQASHSLSDERTEFLIKDRLSFMRFLGLGLADPVPDATIWTFREALTRATLRGRPAIEVLFGKPMPKHTARANGAKSKVRAAVEHVFAHEKGPMGLVVRTIGLARARVKIGLANLVYNMKRTIWLTGRLAPA